MSGIRIIHRSVEQIFLKDNETHLLHTFSLQSRWDGAGIGQQGDLSGGEIALGCLDCDDRPKGAACFLSASGRGEDDRLRY